MLGREDEAHDVHEVPPAGLIRVELAAVQLVRWLNEHGSGRALGRLAQLDHECLAAWKREELAYALHG